MINLAHSFSGKIVILIDCFLFSWRSRNVLTLADHRWRSSEILERRRIPRKIQTLRVPRILVPTLDVVRFGPLYGTPSQSRSLAALHAICLVVAGETRDDQDLCPGEDDRGSRKKKDQDLPINFRRISFTWGFNICELLFINICSFEFAMRKTKSSSLWTLRKRSKKACELFSAIA